MIERRTGQRAEPSEVPPLPAQSASEARGVVARFEAACAELAGLDLAALIRFDRLSDELVDIGARVEQGRRQVSAFDTAYVAALGVADEARRRGASSLMNFLSTQLRISPSEAKRRVRLAEQCGPRPGFTDAERRAALPILAAARRAGRVSDEQSQLILATLEKFPVADAAADPELARAIAEAVAEAECILVETAVTLPPKAVATKGRQLLEAADPAGVLRDFRHRREQRGGSLVANPLGGGRLVVDLCDVNLEKWQTILGPLTKPLPEGPAGPDPRTAKQRFADAMEAVADRVLASDELPASGGTPTTVVLYLTPEQAERRTGMALTDNGNRIPVSEAIRMADQSAITTIVCTAQGVPTDLGRTSRLASPGQTRALAFRDRGCTFPGCSRPPAWCQRHHVIEWIDDGNTDLDNLCLVCSYHHRTFESSGWRVEMRGGLPWWIPPPWIDPRRRPLRNTAHGQLADELVKEFGTQLAQDGGAGGGTDRAEVA